MIATSQLIFKINKNPVSFILSKAENTTVKLSNPYIWITAGILAIIMTLVFIALKLRQRQVIRGLDEMTGMEGKTLSDLDPDGKVKLLGEIWKAKAMGEHIKKGSLVAIKEKKGLTLLVEKLVEKTEEN